MFKILSTYTFVEKIHKMQHLEGSGKPVLYIGRTVLKGAYSTDMSILWDPIYIHCRSQWSRGLRRGSAAARLLGLWVRIPPGAWMSVVSVMCCQVEVSVTG